MTRIASTVPPIDISPEHWAIVCGILEKHVPEYEVWAFGSRAVRKSRRYSDLDLAIITETPLPSRVTGAMIEDFSESGCPGKSMRSIGQR